jgi:hypothetical protein
VVAFTSATAGSGSQAHVFRVDSATCFRLECLDLVVNFAFTLPGGPALHCLLCRLRHLRPLLGTPRGL